MKTIEEKAKKYDKALEIAKTLYCADDVNCMDLETIFPELKESENEKVEKAIFGMVYDSDNDLWSSYDVSKSDVLAWLEKQGEPFEINPTEFDTRLQALIGKFDSLPKEELIGSLSFWLNVVQNDGTYKPDEGQGEQKPADKVGPKFHEGDWVIDKQGFVYQIANVVENVTNHTYGYDIVGGGYFNDNNEDVRLWTIQDAKDGDVLACESGWTCIFKTLVNNETFSSYCFMDNTKWFCETGSECHTLKEEFVKAYNGKIYPATKEQRDTLEKAMADAGYTFDFEKKELKKISQRMISAEAKEALYDKPTDEEMKELLRTEYEKGRADTIAKMKSSWSEEDEKTWKELIEEVKDQLDSVPAPDKQLTRWLVWLKSLKERYTWKPSDEQMKALHDLNLTGNISYAGQGQILIELYNDLYMIWKEK